MIGFLIIARLGSTRLSNKHLIEVQGRTMLEWCVLRIKEQFHEEFFNGRIKIIIATSEKPENYSFNRLAEKLNIDIFFGNDTNIPLRQKQCADKFELNTIISIDGDDILCSVEAMRKVYDLLSLESVGYVSTSGLPLGMNVSGYKTALLNKELERFKAVDILETGWGIVFNNTDKVTYNFEGYKLYVEKIRMTLDYELDSEFFRKIINHFNDEIVSISDIQLFQMIINSNYHKINDSLSEEYWENFNNQKSKLI